MRPYIRRQLRPASDRRSCTDCAGRTSNIHAKRLTVNQVLSKTRRKKGKKVARFQFGLPKTDKSRRTIDLPEFVAAMLTEKRRRTIGSRALAGDRWQENGLLFPSEIGTPLEERNVLRGSKLFAKPTNSQGCVFTISVTPMPRFDPRRGPPEKKFRAPGRLLNQADDGHVRAPV